MKEVTAYQCEATGSVFKTAIEAAFSELRAYATASLGGYLLDDEEDVLLDRALSEYRRLFEEERAKKVKKRVP